MEIVPCVGITERCQVYELDEILGKIGENLFFGVPNDCVHARKAHSSIQGSWISGGSLAPAACGRIVHCSLTAGSFATMPWATQIRCYHHATFKAGSSEGDP